MVIVLKKKAQILTRNMTHTHTFFYQTCRQNCQLHSLHILCNIYIYICKMLYIYHYYLLLLSSSLLLYMLLARNLPSPDPGFSQPFNKNRIAGRGFLHHRGVAPARWTPAFSLVLGAPPTMMGSLMMVNTLPILDTLQKNKFFAG